MGDKLLMTADMFLAEMQSTSARFIDEWKTESEKNPEAYPDAMKPAEWWEQFLAGEF